MRPAPITRKFGRVRRGSPPGAAGARDAARAPLAVSSAAGSASRHSTQVRQTSTAGTSSRVRVAVGSADVSVTSSNPLDRAPLVAPTK